MTCLLVESKILVHAQQIVRGGTMIIGILPQALFDVGLREAQFRGV